MVIMNTIIIIIISTTDFISTLSLYIIIHSQIAISLHCKQFEHWSHFVFNFLQKVSKRSTLQKDFLYKIFYETLFRNTVPGNQSISDTDKVRKKTIRVLYPTMLVSSISFFIVISSMWPFLKSVSVTQTICPFQILWYFSWAQFPLLIASKIIESSRIKCWKIGTFYLFRKNLLQ